MKHTYLIFSLVIFQFSLGQTNSETYYNQFDKLVNSYTTELNNGQRFEDRYITNLDEDFRFFSAKESTIGRLNYNSNYYYEASIKYDLLDDNVLFKDVKSSNPFDVILEPSMVGSFTVYNTNFVRLPVEASKYSFYKNGFFEVLLQSDRVNLYVKHEKFPRKQLGDKSIYYTYDKKQTYLLEYQSGFHEISSRNDVIKIFPKSKEDIKVFYKNNEQLESKNPTEFMKRLFSSIDRNN